MFTSASVAQDLSICLRRQYRTAICCRPKSGRRNRLSSTTFTRHMVSAHPLLQNDSQPRSFEQGQEEVFSPAQESDDVKLRSKVWKNEKNKEICSTADFETDALGEPAKIMLPKVQNEHFLRADNSESALENQHINVSPAEILENIQESTLVDFEEASIHIENLRTSWLSQSQNDRSELPKAKYLQLLDSLQDGFTLNQLTGYYEAEIEKLPKRVFELAHPHSATLYTRSSWVPRCSPFPGKAAEQLRYLKHGRLENTNDVDMRESISRALGTFKQALRTKSDVAETIIQVLWNVKVQEEEGELDMRIESLYLSIFLTNRKSMFHRITETYGAKVNVSRSRRLIRITSDKDTCCDIFKSILQTLENIESVNFYLPPVPAQKLLRSNRSTAYEDSLIKKIEHNTCTIIQKVPHSTSKQKDSPRQYRIFYLGLDEDGLVSAKEELMEAFRFAASDPPSTVWEDEEFLQGYPHPVEVGSALPIVVREGSWSRWASPIKRNSEVALKGKRRDVSQVCSESRLRSIFNILFQYTTSSSLNHPETYQSSSWSESLERRNFATFGQILYPSEQLKALLLTIKSRKVKLRSPKLRSNLYSQRQFFCSFPGLRSMLQNASPGTQVGEVLRIRLRPSPEVLMEEGDKRIFPDVEVIINCDSATKTCEFSSARLILDRHEVDLLLPTEVVDIRFCSMSHIRSGTNTDLEILKFLSSSKIDVFAQEALTFPDTVNFSIPAHLVRKPLSGATLTKKGAPLANNGTDELKYVPDPFLEGTPDIDVKYTLSHYEHWSHISGDIMGLEFQYAVITSSGKMRKREEIRVALPAGGEGEGLPLDVDTFMSWFNVLAGVITKLRDVNQARGNDRNTAASLVPGV